MTRGKRMPLLAVLARRKTFPLLCDDVHEPWSAELSNGDERVHQHVDVVSVDRTEVAEPKLLEQDAGSQKRLQTFFPLSYQRAHTEPFCGLRFDSGTDRGPEPVVERIALYRREILRHRSDVRCDRHLVVVQDDDEVAAGCTRVVQSLVRQAAGQRPVAEYRDDLERLAFQVTRGCHPEAGRDGGRRVSRPEGVVLAFRSLQETGETILLAKRFHPVVAASE